MKAVVIILTLSCLAGAAMAQQRLATPGEKPVVDSSLSATLRPNKLQTGIYRLRSNYQPQLAETVSQHKQPATIVYSRMPVIKLKADTGKMPVMANNGNLKLTMPIARVDIIEIR